MKLAIIGITALVALSGIGTVAAADGKAIYDKSCSACHNNMPPKLGDKAKWGPVMKQDNDALLASVLKGKGAMPPKAGTTLSNDDIKAAIEYIRTKAN
jgi:cytochrome c5